MAGTLKTTRLTLLPPSSILASTHKQNKQRRGGKLGPLQTNADAAAHTQTAGSTFWKQPGSKSQTDIWVAVVSLQWHFSCEARVRWRQSIHRWVCVFVRVCVGLRQNGAAEMRQALQIFVGSVTALHPCQAPTAETTKRRIRLALEPQISSPPVHPSFSFPSFLPPFTLVGVCLDLATLPSVNSSICFYFALIWSRKHGTWNTVGGGATLWCCFHFQISTHFCFKIPALFHKWCWTAVLDDLILLRV